jgi:membrane peptidoglycan carboxypeptidase
MSSIQRLLKPVCLASALLFLFATTFPLTIVAAKGRHAKAAKRGRQSIVRNSSAKSRRAANIKTSALKARDRNSLKTLSRRQRAAESRRVAARRRAEAARLAAIARQRALDEAMRDRVQAMIAKDDVTGEDEEVRRVAVSALGDHAGTVVVMDPQTGRVYSIVNQEWALREGFKPCSTIKLVTGLAGLNENIIDPTDTANISDNNQVDLTRALAFSKNNYFQQVGGQVGFDKMISYARTLGLGEKTGINARNEFQGRMPAMKSGFALNRMSSHGDDFEVTALQLATMVSAMANGGKLLTPFVARTRREEAKLKPRIRRQVNIDPSIWRYMVPGMVGAVNYGSGRRAYDPFQTVAGKTGTCIEQGRTWVGLFTSYAPLTNPRLAVVVIARGTDARGHFPAAVAGRIYRDLNGRFGTPGNLQLATARSDDNMGLEASDDEEETSEESADETHEPSISGAKNSKEASATTVRQPWWGNSKVRRVLMPIPKRSSENVKDAPRVQQQPRRASSQR